MESESSLPYSQEFAIGPYPEPEASGPYPSRPISVTDILMLYKIHEMTSNWEFTFITQDYRRKISSSFVSCSMKQQQKTAILMLQ
jgi:hypothetical protein